jgi:glycosyltransferase involved in cell wall biosynthesis
MLALPKVTYVCPPAWLQRLIGRVPSRSLLCVWTALRARADVVGGFHLIFNGMFALIAARLLGARSVYFCVGGASEIWGGGARSETSLFHRMGRDVPWLERQLLWFIRRIDVTLTMGSGARGYLRDHGITQPIVIMSGGIDASRYIARSDPREREFDLVFVGRLVPIKRTDILLQVLAGVASARPQLRAAIVGDGPLREEMEREVRRLGVERNVHFAGHQSDVASWLHRARMFILTSDSEGLALSLMEAMTAGLPAVVSDVGDLGDIVNHGVNGYLPARRDVPAFVEHTVGLLADSDRYAAFSSAARAAAGAYSIECGSRRWSELLSGWGFTPGGSSVDQS